MPLRLASDFFFRHPRFFLALLLGPPLVWLGVVYVGSLFALLAQSFFHLDDFSGLIVYEPTLATYAELLAPANLDIIIRTVTMAALVTIAAAIIAFPIAYFAARYARGRWKAVFYLGVMLPLWSSYLVRVYAWKLILAKEGILTWLVRHAAPLMAARRHPGGPGDRRAVAVDQLHRHVPGVPLYLAAVHDPAGAGGARACAGKPDRSLRRSRRAARARRSAR